MCGLAAKHAVDCQHWRRLVSHLYAPGMSIGIYSYLELNWGGKFNICLILRLGMSQDINISNEIIV